MDVFHLPAIAIARDLQHFNCDYKIVVSKYFSCAYFFLLLLSVSRSLSLINTMYNIVHYVLYVRAEFTAYQTLVAPSSTNTGTLLELIPCVGCYVHTIPVCHITVPTFFGALSPSGSPSFQLSQAHMVGQIGWIALMMLLMDSGVCWKVD